MDKKLTLPAFGALLLAAAAFGVHLGESAIAQINPLYFQGAAVHPRDRGAAVSEADIMPAGTRFADFYGWEEGQQARTADCVDCSALGARDAYAAGEVRFAVIETDWQIEAQPASYAEPPAEAAPAGEQGFAVQSAEVERYADYPIEAESAEKPPVEIASGAE